MQEDDKKGTQEVSKTALKREVEELQKLAVMLTKLPESQLNQLPLPENFLQAIHEYKQLKSNGAIRRQAQYLGKLMRSIEVEPIQEGLQKFQHMHHQKTQRFHEIEEKVEQLICDPQTVVTEFIHQHPAIDIQKFRQLVKAACQDRERGTNKGGHKALHRFITDTIENSSE